MQKLIKDSFEMKVDVVDAVIEEMCDRYCKYPKEADEDELMDICENCPLNRLQGKE